MKVPAWVLLALLAAIWGSYVIGKQVGGWELAASIKAVWKSADSASEAAAMTPSAPASAPSKRW